MGFFSGEGIGIDLGSSNTTIYLENGGIVLREPTSVLADATDSNKVLAVGGDAHAMLGRVGGGASLYDPLMDGAVTDADMAALFILALAEQATGKRRPMEKAQLLVSMSQGLTKVEKAALHQALRLAGARKPMLVKAPLAAALGAGIQVDQPKGAMIVLLGGAVTEIAVLSMCGIVAARSMRSGAFSMDEAIVRYVRRKKGVVIGLRTAEDLKCDIGSVELPEEDDLADLKEPIAETAEPAAPEEGALVAAEAQQAAGETVLIKGRDARTGKPATAEFTTRDVQLALREPIRCLLDAVKDALSRVPPELSADILDGGIHLSGGGALLKGLPELMATYTGVPVTVSEHPHEDVILGIGRLASDERLLHAALEAGAVEE